MGSDITTYCAYCGEQFIGSKPSCECYGKDAQAPEAKEGAPICTWKTCTWEKVFYDGEEMHHNTECGEIAIDLADAKWCPWCGKPVAFIDAQASNDGESSSAGNGVCSDGVLGATPDQEDV